MKSKQREFWIFTNLNAEKGIDEKALIYHTEPSHPAIKGTAIHVKTVDPEWDALVEEMVEVLQGSPFDGIAASIILSKLKAFKGKEK